MTWRWWKCSECGYVWGSQQTVPDREWCACGTADEPEPIVRPPWQGAHIDGSMHPAACGPRCRSQHTDDHSRCDHSDGPGGAE